MDPFRASKRGANGIVLVLLTVLGVVLAAGCVDKGRQTPLAAAPVSMTFAKGARAIAMGLALVEDGSIVVVGRADTLDGRSWAWAARVSLTGALVWDRDWMSLSDVSALFAATPSTDGGVIAVGEIVVPPEGGGAPRNAGLAMKIDGQGTLAWTRTLDLGAITKMTAVAGDGTGGAMIGAFVARGLGFPEFVARATASGEIVQAAPLGGDSAGWVGLREIDREGYVAIASDLVRLDRAGRPLWRQAGAFRDAAAFPDGSVVAVRLEEHIEMVRFSASGTQLWERHVDDPVICGPVAVWTRGSDEIVVVSNPCAGSDVASVSVFSGSGEKRSVHRVWIGSGVQAMVARPGPSGSIVLAGVEEERKGWVFRSGPVLEPSKE